MSPTRIDLLNKSYTRCLRGYSCAEVDQFMQEVADTLGRLAEDKKLLLAKVSELEISLEQYKEREQTLKDALITTQRVTDSLKSTAQREAQLIIDAANAKAETLLNQAFMRVSQVQEEILDLKKLRVQFDMKLKAVIDSHLKLLDMNRKEQQELDAAESKVKYLKKAEG